MTRDEIYDHLAQVYLGKRSKNDDRKRREFNAWLVINVFITAIIFVSAFYGLTAFLTQKSESLQNRVIFALTNSSIRVKYDLNDPFPPVKTFSLSIPEIDLSKYTKLNFSIRGFDEGYPGIVKIIIRNQKKENAAYFVNNVKLDWQEISIPLTEFKDISDWTNLTDISFVFEAWNVDKKRGIVLIDEVSFSS